MDKKEKSEHVGIVRDICDVLVSQLPLFYHLLDLLNTYQGDKLRFLSDRTEGHTLFLEQYLEQMDNFAEALFTDFSVMGKVLTKLQTEQGRMDPFLKHLVVTLQHLWRGCIGVVPSQNLSFAIKGIAQFLSCAERVNYSIQTAQENRLSESKNRGARTSLPLLTSDLTGEPRTILPEIRKSTGTKSEEEPSTGVSSLLLENYLNGVFTFLGADQEEKGVPFKKVFQEGVQNLWKALNTPMEQFFSGGTPAKNHKDKRGWEDL